MKDIPIILPSYEPDGALTELVKDLSKTENLVIIVNDGSGEKYDSFFEEAKSILKEKCILISYKENRGKGYALKAAFSYILEHFPDALGAVTADSDGQHSCDEILKIRQELSRHPLSLILGVREFESKTTPWKSAFGNKMSAGLLALTSNIKVTDTQCGLRGIPLAFMSQLIKIRENRFAFETEMLIKSSGTYPILEVPIKTIYIDNNRATHFRPVADSLKILVSICRIFFAYSLLAIASSCLDLLLFWFWCRFLKIENPVLLAGAASVLARIASVIFNFTMNYKVVFMTKNSVLKAAEKYILVACFQMLASAALLMMSVRIFGSDYRMLLKVIIDTVLFLVTFQVQARYTFANRKSSINNMGDSQ